MCLLKRKVKLPKKGYKVVILKDGAKYSPAMGMKYVDGKKIVPIKRQRRLTGLYSSKILNPKFDRGFSKHMQGRTAIIKDLADAYDLYCRVKLHIYIPNVESPNVETAIFEATVSVDIMAGTIGRGSKKPVYAGRVISFGERIY